MLLRRAPSFSRQRKAPRLPPPSSTPQHVGSSPATYTPAPEGEVVICKALRGWLKKRHRSDKSLGPKWGARFVWVDENEGTLCYSKAQNYSSSARTCVRLCEVTAVWSDAFGALAQRGHLAPLDEAQLYAIDLGDTWWALEPPRSASQRP